MTRTPGQSPNPKPRDGLTILIVGALTHWLVLLNDGIYWDDWSFRSLSGGGLNWQNILAVANETGGVITNVWLARIYDLVDFRVMTFASILAIGLLVYLIATETDLIGRVEALFVALLTVTYPAYQTWVLFSTASYALDCALFFAAVLLALRSERSAGGARILLRVAALVLFFLSFGVSSLLPFYFGFVLLLFLLVRRSQGSTVRQTLKLAPRYLDYILLPFLFWVIKQAFFPRRGLYLTYNKFTFSPAEVAANLRLFLANGILAQLKESALALLNQPAVALVLGFGVYALAKRTSYDLASGSRSGPNKVIAFGLALLGLSIFPYVAVGLSPAVHGWGTRHALLLGLPVAILCVGLARLGAEAITSPLPAGRSANRPDRGIVLLSGLVLLFVLATTGNYVGWQARWAKDRAVMANLAAVEGLQRTSVFWVKDDSRIGTEEGYQFYEWSRMLDALWGGQSRIGLDERLNNQEYWSTRLMKLRKFFSDRYALANFDAGGRQTFLTIRRGPGAQRAGDLAVAGRYLLYRYLLPDRLPGFLAALTDVEARPGLAAEE